MSVESILRNLRVEKDQTLIETAKAVGLSRSGYQQIEIGIRSVDGETAAKIAAYFGVPVEGIFVPKNYSVRLVQGA